MIVKIYSPSQAFSSMALLSRSGGFCRKRERFSGCNSVRTGDASTVWPFCWSTPCLSDAEHAWLMGVATLRVQKRRLDRSSAIRRYSAGFVGVEKMMRRVVRAGNGQDEKEDQPKPTEMAPAGIEVWKAKARELQTTARILTSTLFWVALFFIASVWDGDSKNKSVGKRGPRK